MDWPELSDYHGYRGLSSLSFTVWLQNTDSCFQVDVHPQNMVERTFAILAPRSFRVRLAERRARGGRGSKWTTWAGQESASVLKDPSWKSSTTKQAGVVQIPW